MRAVDPEFVWRVTGMCIVIAPYQRDLQCGVRAPPFGDGGECIGMSTLSSVEQVAQHHEM